MSHTYKGEKMQKHLINQMLIEKFKQKCTEYSNEKKKVNPYRISDKKLESIKYQNYINETTQLLSNFSPWHNNGFDNIHSQAINYSDLQFIIFKLTKIKYENFIRISNENIQKVAANLIFSFKKIYENKPDVLFLMDALMPSTYFEENRLLFSLNNKDISHVLVISDKEVAVFFNMFEEYLVELLLEIKKQHRSCRVAAYILKFQFEFSITVNHIYYSIFQYSTIDIHNINSEVVEKYISNPEIQRKLRNCQNSFFILSENRKNDFLRTFEKIFFTIERNIDFMRCVSIDELKRTILCYELFLELHAIDREDLVTEELTNKAKSLNIHYLNLDSIWNISLERSYSYIDYYQQLVNLYNSYLLPEEGDRDEQ